ncbi:hypothetical protein BU24DRAFT_31113 [Aaosphaeria arxii CBS 175.79]|uniref:Uncharacterized protein n=1 Tax=Aaosphaeria arxii CBS 175.79 TaxID=1450172 RepID=A0A6A5Y8X6_9PLEO|nr:uncharacterized protein BU24DRAFT_31113 [Aaosphaeria arxii CBS 175.79]KAF2021868.1 hypothetical protein BU24DRAFT_31113 [Aaosphaeria arxii CBS 175.79]
MTDIMARPGVGLSAPSSRQDVISALLNDYGTSFGREDASSFDYPLSPEYKELPPPPTSDEKPLPPIMMKFQLRVDDNVAPGSPSSDGSSSPDQPKRIVSRMMSRNSKPPSLTLHKSNGSTAYLPDDVAPPRPAKDDVFTSTPSGDRPLPPPPPPKSERRRSSLKQASRPERRDSKEPELVVQGPLRPAPTAPVKRKPLPSKGFVSLADLGTGPRGRKPVRQSEEGRRPSEPNVEKEVPVIPEVDNQKPTVSKIENPFVDAPPVEAPVEVPVAAPVEVPVAVPEVKEEPQRQEAPLPPPPRKIFGLPSNPRALSKTQVSETQKQESKHMRGKSSTGMDIMKSASNFFSKKSPTTNVAPVPSSITPGPTPSPRKTESIQTGAAIQKPTLASTIHAALVQSPISPISPESDSMRPFSYEAPKPAKQTSLPQQQQPRQQHPPTPPQDKEPLEESPISPIESSRFPPRTTSRQAPPPSQTTSQPSPPLPLPQPSTTTTIPPFPLSQTSTSSSSPDDDNLPPFIPLTRQPIPTPARPIKPSHLHCYTTHATFSRYTARFQPPTCMVCLHDQPGFRATCSCCFLQLCADCDRELGKTAGRDLAALVGVRGKTAATTEGVERGSKASLPSVIVSNDDDDFS